MIFTGIWSFHYGSHPGGFRLSGSPFWCVSSFGAAMSEAAQISNKRNMMGSSISVTFLSLCSSMRETPRNSFHSKFRDELLKKAPKHWMMQQQKGLREMLSHLGFQSGKSWVSKLYKACCFKWHVFAWWVRAEVAHNFNMTWFWPADNYYVFYDSELPPGVQLCDW